MAGEFIFEFGTRSLEKVRDLVRAVDAQLTGMAGRAGAIARRAGGVFTGGGSRSDIAALRGRLRDRASAIRRDLFSGDRDDGQRERLRIFEAWRGTAGRLVRGLRSARQVGQGDILSGVSFLATLAPGTPARTAVAAFRLIRQVVDERIKEREAELQRIADDILKDKFDDLRRELDVDTRLEEDVRFSQAVARNVNREARQTRMSKYSARPRGGLGDL